MLPATIAPHPPACRATDPIGAPIEGDAAATVAITDLLDDLATVGPRLHAQVEEQVGLRLGQVRILHAVSEGNGVPTGIATITGEHIDAVTATLRSLCAADLVTRQDDTGSREGYVITEAGRVRLDQFTAVQLRSLAELPPTITRRMLASLRVLGARRVARTPSGTPEVSCLA